GQCLRTAVARVLGRPAHTLPLRTTHQDVDDWLVKVGDLFHVEFRFLHAGQPAPLMPWIAFFSTIDPETTHAVAMCGHTPLDGNRWPFNGWLTGITVHPTEAT